MHSFVFVLVRTSAIKVFLGHSKYAENMHFTQVFGVLTFFIGITGNIHLFKRNWGPYDNKYGHFPERQRLQLLEEARQMFTFGYDNYMNHAFPKDELDPIHCTGRGPDVGDPYVYRLD